MCPECSRDFGAPSAKPRRSTTAASSSARVCACSGAQKYMRRCGSSGRSPRPSAPLPNSIRSAIAMSANSPSRKCIATTTRCARNAANSIMPSANRRPISTATMRSLPARASRSAFRQSLKLLRAGAHVIVTTRFPVDAVERYSKEPDFGAFRERLEIHGLDLRHTPSVELFTQFLLERLPRLDYLLNNACQTVRRPAGFFEHLLARESAPLAALPDAWRGPLASHGELRRRIEGSQKIAPRHPGRGRGVCTARDCCTARRCRSGAISMRTIRAATRCFPPAATMRICSRSTCAR